MRLVTVTVENSHMDTTDDDSLESSVKATFETLAAGTLTQLAQTIVDPNKKYSTALFRVADDRAGVFEELVNGLTLCDVIRMQEEGA